MATNLLGLELNRHMLEDRDKYSGVTLGAFRRSKSVNWLPGATIDVWTKCARTENATGVPWPHALFIQTIRDGSYGGIFCPQCRVEVAELRAKGLLDRQKPEAPKKQTNQLSLF